MKSVTIRYAVLTVALAVFSIAANALGDTVSNAPAPAQPATVFTAGLGDLTLATAKFLSSYIQTNGSQSASSGFAGFGSGHVKCFPVLSQSLTLARTGKDNVDTFSFGIEHATAFQPSVNRECLGLDVNLHIWKNSKVGKIFCLDFNDAGLAVGVDAPVDWFNGRGIRLDGMIVRAGAFIHF